MDRAIKVSFYITLILFFTVVPPCLYFILRPHPKLKGLPHCRNAILVYRAPSLYENPDIDLNRNWQTFPGYVIVFGCVAQRDGMTVVATDKAVLFVNNALIAGIGYVEPK
ncbi:MAG TPA: hypothetical protein VNJ52_04910 [Patescibacteria group bacterium]|nr:hypothetical protein [Patescibacteria group bacterium]